MTLRYLLDTNILSEPARPQPHPGLARKLDQHRGELATASIVVHEMVYGLERMPKSKKRDWIAAYLRGLRRSNLPVLPYDEQAAQWHAQERARLERIGRVLPFRDAQIAAVAQVHGLVLVTANLGDFEGLADLEMENWLP